MRELKIQENDANQRLDKFITKALPSLPKSLMYKYIRNKKIKVNGKRCTFDQRLDPGDIVTFYIKEEFFQTKKDRTFLQASADLDIVYEDENILIMNKPIGLLCHQDEHEEIDTLVNRMKLYLYQNKAYDPRYESSFAPALAHRIDRNTQGLVLGAKNAQALRDLNERLKCGQIGKHYLCIIEGQMNTKKGTLSAFHRKEDKQVLISDSAKKGYKEISMDYRVLEMGKQYSLLDVTLHTGKSHQIRALLAHNYHPLAGDVRYGGKRLKQEYQALCAYRLIFYSGDDSLSYLNGKYFELEKMQMECMKLWERLKG